MSHVLPNISRGRFFEPIFTSKKFDLYTSIYGTYGPDMTIHSAQNQSAIAIIISILAIEYCALMNYCLLYSILILILYVLYPVGK